MLHRGSGSVSCHHCGHRERVPERCPDCGSVSVSRHGVGTERLEHELMTTLADPAFPVMRLDADSSGVDARARTLAAFHAAPAGVLVGTQMIAKGHDFADVGLGGRARRRSDTALSGFPGGGADVRAPDAARGACRSRRAGSRPRARPDAGAAGATDRFGGRARFRHLPGGGAGAGAGRSPTHPFRP